MHENALIVPGPDGPASDNWNTDPRGRERGSDSMKHGTKPRAVRDLFNAE